MEKNATALSDKTSPLGKRVLLICPPFHDPNLSSLSIALLATYLGSNGIHCEEAYLNLEFYAVLGKEKYDNIVSSQGERWKGPTAELLFAEAIHGELRDLEFKKRLEALVGTGEQRRAMLDRFERSVIERIQYERPKLVGITTSLNQLLAAVWMTRIIKRLDPGLQVVFGGTACDAPMGERIAEAYPEVDYVVSGYGELPLLKLAAGETPSGRLITSDVPVDLESIPVPEYRPFLREVAEYNPDMRVSLLFQSSRGCWWGQKRHCAFCGLNGEKMPYHAKPSEQVLDDIRTLWEAHKCNLIATDSIMDRNHLKEMLPRLSRFQERPTVFYEMKANLSEDDVVAMAEAQVTAQVGIESLSSRLLKLLKKGLTTIRALALLKWSREHKVVIFWNQLCGIPGETIDDYDSQIALMAAIPHFPPPYKVNPIIIDRYSPYFDDYRAYGWQAIEPVTAYRAAHPHIDDDALYDLVHHFEGEGGVSTEGYLDRFEDAVNSWKVRYERGDGLFWNRFEGLVRIENAQRKNILVNQTVTRIIEATHRIVSVKRVVNQTGCDAALIDEMVENGILYIESGNAINLTVRTR
jgi:ribosomal peptide maturation radical SAM protein 1